MEIIDTFREFHQEFLALQKNEGVLGVTAEHVQVTPDKFKEIIESAAGDMYSVTYLGLNEIYLEMEMDIDGLKIIALF